MRAKYRGNCASCAKRISPGMEVVHLGRYQTFHQKCFDKITRRQPGGDRQARVETSLAACERAGFR